MRPIDIERFSSIASQSPITDVLLAIERSGNGSDGEWTSLEGGPILLCFDDHCAVLRQPVGALVSNCFTRHWMSGTP